METITVKPNMVKKMRQIRNQISSEILNMTLEEQKEYIKKEIDELKKKREKANSKG